MAGRTDASRPPARRSAAVITRELAFMREHAAGALRPTRVQLQTAVKNCVYGPTWGVEEYSALWERFGRFIHVTGSPTDHFATKRNGMRL